MSGAAMGEIRSRHSGGQAIFDGQKWRPIEAGLAKPDWWIDPQDIIQADDQPADPFGDAVKAAQDLPEPSKNYTPERFSDNKDFDADKAWRETMGSSW
jgi:hypothetical protein